MDDDRFDAGGHRLDEDQVRLAEAATPLGFEMRQPRKRPWDDYALQCFETPNEIAARVSGEVNGARVEIFEYGWEVIHPKRSPVRGKRVVVVAQHPAFAGEARCKWNEHQSVASQILPTVLGLIALVAFFWIVLPVWLIWYLQGKRVFGKDWKVGDATFDERFIVDGPSLAQAKAALPMAFQTFAVSEGLTGPIEIRPGLVAFDLPGDRLDAAALEQAVRTTKHLVDAFDPSASQPRAAYRVAGEVMDERNAGPEEEPASDSSERRSARS